MVDIMEYGPVPQHLANLGMTQQNWFDWVDGGDTTPEADKIVDQYLVQKYGEDQAEEIRNRYELDGTNRFVDTIAADLDFKL